MKYSRTMLLGLLLPLAIVATSCSKREDRVITKIGDRKVTVRDFELSYAHVSPEFLPTKSGFEGKKEFMVSIVNKELMAYKADELGYDKDPVVVQGMEAFRKLGLQAGYLKRRVFDEVKVTEADVRKHYKNRGATLAVKQILLDTPDEAAEVYAFLDQGKDFETLLKQYSKSPDAAEGGNVLTVTYGSFTPALQMPLFELPVGGYTKPIWAQYGYFIIKVLKRDEPRKQDPYEEIHDKLEEELRVIKEIMGTNDVSDAIRERYGVEWFWDGLRICFHALPEDRSINNPPRRSDEVYPLLYFDPKDFDMPVCKYEERMLTVRDFSDFYDQASFFTRPQRSYRLGGVRTFLTGRIMNDIILVEMARSNIEKDPEVMRVLRNKQEELMIGRLYDDMVNKHTVVTREMIQSFYQENPNAFRVPERRRFGVILAGDAESARKAEEQVRKGTPFRTVALAFSVDPATKDNMGETELLSLGEQPEIGGVGFALSTIGEVSAPFQTSRGWAIVKLVEREDERVFSFSEASDQVQGALKQQLNDTRLNELLEKWKEELSIVIDDKALAKTKIEERIPGEPAAAPTKP